MLPNNNLSVLPWYRSLAEQNARRWWVFGRIFPLFSPATRLLPFQIMRDTLLKYTPGLVLPVAGSDDGYMLPTGEVISDNDYGFKEYHISGITDVYFENLTKCPDGAVAVVAYDSNDDVVGTFTPEFDEDGYFTGGWTLPAGTSYIYAQTKNNNLQITKTTVAYDATTSVAPVDSVKIYKNDGTLVGDYSAQMAGYFTVKPFNNYGYDVIVFEPDENNVFSALSNGQYYAELKDAENTLYSEVFTVVNDLTPYLKITWYDQTDFVMDAGTIVYTSPAFRNVLYLDATLAKPEYPFEEEGENRDGYFFPVKQISEKRYRFKFFAAEYLLDVMRFIRMADYAVVEFEGQTYNLDTFLITPEWEANGDVASVEAVFDTATVAKKIGVGYIKASE